MFLTGSNLILSTLVTLNPWMPQEMFVIVFNKKQADITGPVFIKLLRKISWGIQRFSVTKVDKIKLDPVKNILLLQVFIRSSAKSF